MFYFKICCGCFGPDGGTDNYCRPDCTAKNGGTVVKTHTYSWFWVRTSLPKRVWNRCMEYKVKNDKGEMVSYRLLDGNPTPEKVQNSKCHFKNSAYDCDTQFILN